MDKKDKYFQTIRHENKPILLLRYNDTEWKAEVHLTFRVHLRLIPIVDNLQVVFPSGQSY